MGRLPLTGHNTRKDLDMTTWQTDVIDDALESWSPEAIQLVNLTPHAITLMPVGGVTSTTIEPSGQVARVRMTSPRSVPSITLLSPVSLPDG